MCSKHKHHFKFSNEHNGKGLCNNLQDRESSLEPLTFAFQISLLKLEMILYISRGLFG